MISTCNNKKTMTAQERSEANVGSSDQIHFSESHSLKDLSCMQAIVEESLACREVSISL